MLEYYASPGVKSLSMDTFPELWGKPIGKLITLRQLQN